MSECASDDAAVAACARLLRSQTTLRRLVAAELQTEHGLTVNEYEALLLLAEAPDRRMRGVDLAEGLGLTPSGVTRLLDGLCRLGLVERERCPSDARVAYAVLLDPGSERLRAAGCTYVRTIKAIFEERFTEQELHGLSELLGRLPGRQCTEASCTEAAASASTCAAQGPDEPRTAHGAATAPAAPTTA